MINNVRMNLKPLQFVAIYTLLSNVRLGSRSFYEDTISDLMIEMEELGVEGLVDNICVDTGMFVPEIMVECSNSDGLVLNLV